MWRVEKMDLKPVPPEAHGEFFVGDTYLLLFTMAKFDYNIHTWIGSEATADEICCAPIFMTQLDDYLGKKPKQYTEYQNEESIVFMGYFKSGVKYKKGGIASGFTHAKKDEVKRLLHVKGRHNIRAVEVPMTWKSFNKGDSFLIDLGEVIYRWAGSESNPYECLKATTMATDIRDGERGGSAKIVYVDEGSEPEEVIKLLGPKPELPSSTTEDKSADRKNKMVASLYLISDAAGAMKTTVVAEKNPFKQSMLSDKDCYILDNVGDKTIFVWKGKESSKNERSAALGAANKFIKEKNYPSTTKIMVMASGAEDAMFKQFFFNWLDKDETTGPSQFKARLFACSNKTGTLTSEEVPGALSQQDLATDDVMILDSGKQLFIWVGKDANEAEKTGASKMAQEFLSSDPSGRKDIPITSMQQGEEIPAFIDWFPAWDPKMWD